MAITNEVVVSFLNQTLRPLCERLRAVQVELETSRVAYQVGPMATVAAAVGADPVEVVDDGRATEGVNQLSADEVAAAMGLLNDIAAAVAANPAGLAAMHKACVRPLRITTVSGV